VKRYVYNRLAEVLRGEDTTQAFERLTSADRQAILEILSATKPAFVQATAHADEPGLVNSG
jgi:hypothetical protein